MKSENLKIMINNNIPVPEFVVLTLGEKWNESVEEKVIAIGAGPYAVRSSAGVEDSKELSFAGQFYTALNICFEDLEDTVLKVKSEIENYCADEYAGKKLQDKIPGTIIIQKMVDAKMSGVIFTSNPMNLLNETVIVVGDGLGCGVVEDRTETTTYYYNLTDDIYYSDKGKVNLSEDIIQKLVTLSKKIKEIFNDRMDIEFAIDENDGIWILQARSITTIDSEKVTILDSSNIAESYPGVTLPMSQEFVYDMYTTVFRNCVLMISGDEKLVEDLNDSFNHMVAFVNGRAYYEIENFYELLKLVPFSKKLIEIWQNSLGVTNKQTGDSKIKIGLLKKWSNLFKLISMMRKSPKEMEKLDIYFKEKIDIYRQMVDEAEDIDSLLECYVKIKDDLGYKWGITLVNDLYAFWYTARVKDKDKIANVINMESMKPTILLNEMIEAYQQQGKNSSEFTSLFDRYMDLYSDRCIGELKLETKTYRTNPELLMNYVQTHQTTKIANEEQREDPTGKNTKSSKNKNIERAKLGICNRESSRMNRTRIYGIVRQIYLKIGEILVRQSKLDDKTDVFYLTKGELKLSSEEIRKIVEKQKMDFEQFEKIPYFSRLEFAGDTYDNKVKVSRMNAVGEEGLLSGTPTSAGEVEAEAIIIDSPSDDIDVTGKIIVTKSTDPGWVILVKNCAGIIAERGSILSHTAIITRELKKPSVVNVKNATTLIKNDDRVFLSGDTGEIIIR